MGESKRQTGDSVYAAETEKPLRRPMRRKYQHANIKLRNGLNAVAPHLACDTAIPGAVRDPLGKEGAKRTPIRL
jgi:hypothetical protein